MVVKQEKNSAIISKITLQHHILQKKRQVQSQVSYSSSPEESTESTDGVFLGCSNKTKLSDANIDLGDTTTKTGTE